MVLFREYTPEKYPTYDNYCAINVDRTVDIPCDYYGIMGVPITFLSQYNPEQFEIVAFRKGDDGRDLVYSFTDSSQNVKVERDARCKRTSAFSFAEYRHPAANGERAYVSGQRKYARLLIRHKNTRDDKKQ